MKLNLTHKPLLLFAVAIILILIGTAQHIFFNGPEGAMALLYLIAFCPLVTGIVLLVVEE